MQLASKLAVIMSIVGSSFGLITPTIVHAAPFSKVCNNGAIEGSALCPAGPTLGSGPTQWGCTLDRGTQLLWEVKTASGPRDYRGRHSNLDVVGPIQTGGPIVTTAQINTLPNSLGYVRQVNAATLCTRSNWTRPTSNQLQSLVPPGSKSGFDTTYFIDLTFPNAPANVLPTLSSTPIPNNPQSYTGLSARSGLNVNQIRAQNLSVSRLVVAWNNGIPCGGLGQEPCKGSNGEGSGGN